MSSWADVVEDSDPEAGSGSEEEEDESWRLAAYEAAQRKAAKEEQEEKERKAKAAKAGEFVVIDKLDAEEKDDDNDNDNRRKNKQKSERQTTIEFNGVASRQAPVGPGSAMPVGPSRGGGGGYGDERRSNPVPDRPPYTAFVGNLSFDVDEEKLRDFFEDNHCLVKSVRIMMDRETGRPKGYGYVEFVDRDGLATSVEYADGEDFMGRPIRVNVADPKTGGRSDRGGGRGYDREPSRAEETSDWRSAPRTTFKPQDRGDRGYGGGRDRGGYGGDRDRGYGRRDDDRDDRFAPRSSGERPKLKLDPVKPRPATASTTTSSSSSSNPFGGARPVDTFSRQRQLEQERLEREKKAREAARAPKQEREPSRADAVDRWGSGGRKFEPRSDRGRGGASGGDRYNDRRRIQADDRDWSVKKAPVRQAQAAAKPKPSKKASDWNKEEPTTKGGSANPFDALSEE